MNVLALETSGRVITIALQYETQYFETLIDAGFRHAETLMPGVDALLSQANMKAQELDLVVVSAGPGSFTGIRIGMATAKGIARGAQCPVKSVPTLPLLAAQREHWPGIVMPIMDARKKRVYAAAFQKGKRIVDDVDVDLKEFLKQLPANQPILATGPDAQVAAEFNHVVIDPMHASARGRALIRMGCSAFETEGADAPDSHPIYLRLSEAEEALGKQA
ncbi:MAG: tRNA (adenosine(37)-N6)-threonylcarbamoyltransferase complex dimerization subunit type 1 TsaB [Spirochaetales bacterium]|nr:tRNA (adenosine(37)-N6)-threonylcarbamoyltransferase complex dimerization subunit type 1 TsaB [Spirochaetales bacterium]